jgi:putative tryptophan/tyrosine transport system substrate-binding protein
MKRRQFITLLGGAAAWPVATQAQQAGRVKRIGLLMTIDASDPEVQLRLAALNRGLQDLGWIDGRSIRIDYCWAGSDADRMRTCAAELVDLAPDVVLAHTPPAVVALQNETETIPIVFMQGGDPVSAGLVQSLANPGGNITGFSSFEYAMGEKWLELVK